MKTTLLNFATVSLLLFAGCSKEGEQNAKDNNTNNLKATAAINAGTVYQVVDGIGGASVWSGTFSDADANACFSNGNSNQLGMTICRVRADPNGNNASDITNAQKAHARGAKVLMSVWSPPASMKSNNSTVGGSLNTASYAAYATWLSNAKNSFGADVVSIQNEPNITVTYESCSWNSTQLLNFCKNNAQNIGAPVMMPEAFNFDDAYSDPTLNDATAASHISYLGGHIYGGGLRDHTNARNKGKKVWMTEHYYDNGDISTFLSLSKEIGDCFANYMNAYVYWYVLKGTGNCLLVSNGTPNKKGYMFGQWSKFVRPGYQRISITSNPQSGLYVYAFKNGGQIIVVAVNQNTSVVNQQFTLTGASITGLNRYTTSSSKNIAQTSFAVTNNSWGVNIDAQSTTTYVSY